MLSLSRTWAKVSVLGIFCAGLGAAIVQAERAELLVFDGTETLGDTTLGLAAGTSLTAGGVGLQNGQPADLSFTVPAGNTVQQVILYWSGFMTADGAIGDSTITVDGNVVNGTLIGGPTKFFNNATTSSFRADITGLAIALQGAGAGVKTFSMGGLAFTGVDHGAGMMVILDDGSTLAEIGVKDGSDAAFINFAPPLDTTVPQTFNFAAAGVDRVAQLVIMTGSVVGPDLAGPRPNIIRATVDGVDTDFADLLGSNDGAEWDTVIISIPIPAGVASFTVQLLSEDAFDTGNRPASLIWVAAGGAIVPEDGGGGGEGCTPGFWKNLKRRADLWDAAGFDPDQTFLSAYGCDLFPGMTLEDVIRLGGGGLNRLGRHSVAALLNASHPNVDYAFSATEVIDATCEFGDSGDAGAIATLGDILVLNNELGCDFSS